MSSSFQRAINAVRAQFNRNLLHLGDYEVNRTADNMLGKGGFGTVWRGKNVRTEEIVAVKQVEKREQTKKFLEREIKFLQQCKHENIVKLYELVEEKEWVFLVMELCGKGNLDKFMKDKAISILRGLNLIKDVTCAVEYMHANELVHRDIKPENVLVRDSGCCVLADLGLSRDIPDSEASATLTAVGTEGWMAPEVFTRHYGMAVDIFALGLVILAIVKHHQGQRLVAHKEDDIPLCHWMKTHRRSLPSLDNASDDNFRRDVKALVLQMINYEPSARLSIGRVLERILHIIDKLTLRVEKLSEERLGFDADWYVGMFKSGHVLLVEKDSPYNLHKFLLQDNGRFSEQWTQPRPPPQHVSLWCRKYFCEDQSILLQDHYSSPTHRYTATLQHVDEWSQEGELVQCLPPSRAVYRVKKEGRLKLVVREEDGSRTTLSPPAGHEWSHLLSVCETPAGLVVLDAGPDDHYFLTTFPPGKPPVTTRHEGNAMAGNGVCCWEDRLLVTCYSPTSVRLHSSSGRLLQTISRQQLQLLDNDVIGAVGVSGQRLMAVVKRGWQPAVVTFLFVYELSWDYEAAADEAAADEEGATAGATASNVP